MTYVFIDDKRDPSDVVGYEGIDWVVVRSAEEFYKYLNDHGMPGVISFDHDLDDEHYDIDWEKVYHFNEPVQYKYDTGLDCLKNLIRRLTMNIPNLDNWPSCAVHSLNPVGRDEIDKHLERWSFPRFGKDI